MYSHHLWSLHAESTAWRVDNTAVVDMVQKVLMLTQHLLVY